MICLSADPPSVKVLTPIPHPHVHDDRVCLDLLSDYKGYFRRALSSSSINGTQTGWSPAYSVLSVLLQLQAFLLELDDEEEVLLDDVDDSFDSEGENGDADDLESSAMYGEGEESSPKKSTLEEILVSIPAAIKASRRFACSKCPHRAPDHVWPELREAGEELQRSGEDEKKAEPLLCFHTKRSWQEDVLGLGVYIERVPSSSRIRSVQTGLDLVSWTAFNHLGVRCGVLQTEHEWTHWIPLWINKEHGSRAYPLFQQVLSFIFTGSATAQFRPEWAFEMIPKLMNHFIVQIMKGDVYASERALEGYCYFHRWLQVFSAAYPDFMAGKLRVIEDFINDPKKRHKDFVPDIGEFVTLISLDIKYAWKDVREAYLTECYSRNAFWVVKSFPKLRKTEPDAALDAMRSEQTFEANRVSLQLALFHRYFLEHVGRPPQMSGAQIAERYDKRCGRPSRAMRVEWHAACQSILRVQSWDEYFAAMQLPGPGSKEALNEMLRNIMANSPYVDAAQKGTQKGPQKGRNKKKQ